MAEIRTRRGWRALARSGPTRPGREAASAESPDLPQVLETDTIQIRGLSAGQTIELGRTELTADHAGTAVLHPGDDEHLNGHVGLIEVAIDGMVVGEIDLIPDKMSEPAYQVLRSDLQRVWTDLIFADESPTSVRAAPPSPRELWRRIDRPLMQILDQPNMLVDVGIEPRRLDRVRRARELTPAVVRAGQRNRPALTRTLQRTTDTPENQLCTATLQLLRNHARRDADAVDIVSSIDRLLRHPTLPVSNKPLRRITWGMRSDRRYQQILVVHQLLQRPELEATEGPGELRLGTRALPRLYEYWVFLQILLAATEIHGPPLRRLIEDLAVPVRGNRHRLEINRGTTITFPGPVHIAFEPDINTRGDGWMGIEYVPHPDRERQQFGATPDVAVLDLSNRWAPSLTIIDAKYVGRGFVELDAVRMHDKYARMRLHGVPVVDNVLVAHPHAGFSYQWAGYGHFPLTPGRSGQRVPLPSADGQDQPSEAYGEQGRRIIHPDSPDRPLDDQTVVTSATPIVDPPAATRRTAPAGGIRSAAGRPTATGGSESDRSNRQQSSARTEPVLVIADQFWMSRSLRGRRIDLRALRNVAAGGRDVYNSVMLVPQIAQLTAFGYAAEHNGWHVEWLDSDGRLGQISFIVEAASSHLPDGVVVISGDPQLLLQLPAGVEIFNDLESVADL